MNGSSSLRGIKIEHIVDPFYEIGSSTEILPGQFVWIPSLYPNKDGNALDIIKEKYDPSEKIIEFVINPYQLRSNNFPVKRLNLASDEFLFTVKGKIRLAIVIAGGLIEWGRGAEEKLYLCIPLYTVDKPKISQEFVVKVQANRYPMYFYIPPDGGYHIKESIARFPLTQVVHGNTIKYFPNIKKPISLSDEACGWLKTQLGIYLNCSIDEELKSDLDTYGDLIFEEYRKKK